MCFGHTTLEMAIALLEDDIPEENLASALAAQAPLAGFSDGDLPFSVAE